MAINRVAHAHSWKILKPHISQIIEQIIFPIMQFNEKDQELYEDDPVEYVRQKFGRVLVFFFQSLYNVRS